MEGVPRWRASQSGGGVFSILQGKLTVGRAFELEGICIEL